MEHEKDMLLTYNLDQNTTDYQEFTLKYRGQNICHFYSKIGFEFHFILGLLVNVKGAPFYFRLNQEILGHFFDPKSKSWHQIIGEPKSNPGILRNVLVHYEHIRNSEIASCQGLKNLENVTQELSSLTLLNATKV